jgi:hypothetical protein
MHIATTVRDQAGHLISTEFYGPDSCPLCHHGIQPGFLSAVWIREKQQLEAVFRCPRGACQHLFIGVYSSPYATSSNWQLQHLAPSTVTLPTFPESVTKLSPRFVEIMEQVAHADARKLDQINGMGLRKALEFLIKDFAIEEHPDQKSSIEKSDLANVIGRYVKDGNINACAKRAVWLGNDETHYLRKWEDKDITHLKDLVRLTVNWIDSHEMTKAYREEMPEGKN